MKMSIRKQALVSTGICIALSIVINLGMVRITRGLANDASHSELAAQIALLSERWVNNALLYAKDPSRERHRRLETTMESFDAALTLMRTGGDGMALLSTLDPVPPLRDRRALELLVTTAKHGHALEATTKSLLSSGGNRGQDVVRAIERQSAAAVATARKLSAVLARQTQSAADFMVVVELVALAMCLGAGLVAMDVGRRLTGAITRLTQDADRVSMGRSEEPIAAQGPGEIAVLAKSVDRMRVSLQKALRMLQQTQPGSAWTPD